MELTNITMLTIIGLAVLTVHCHCAPVSDDATSSISQILRKLNKLLDFELAKETAATKTHEEADLQMQQRNEAPAVRDSTKRGLGVLQLICIEMHMNGIDDPGCHDLDNDPSTNAERSFSDVSETNQVSGLKRHSRFIDEICKVFADNGIYLEECAGQSVAERSITEIESPIEKRGRKVSVIQEICELYFLHYGKHAPECVGVADAEKREEEERQFEFSEPEPAPRAAPTADNQDISLEKVLQYLQYLRRTGDAKRD